MAQDTAAPQIIIAEAVMDEGTIIHNQLLNAIIEKQLTVAGYPDAESFIRDYVQGNIRTVSDGGQITVAGNIDEFNSYIDGKIDQTVVDSYGQLDTDSIKSLFNDQYVAPMEQNAQNAKNIITDRHREEKGHIADYNEILESYSPIFTTEFIARNTSQMQKNNSELQQKVTENNMSYVDYANKVYQTTQENMNNLQQHIQEAKESSEKAVTNGLHEAKGIKNSTSSNNQNLLAGFTEKLPFTRLGSMEYKQTYEFIVNPAKVQEHQADMEQWGVMSRVTAVTAAKQEGISSPSSHLLVDRAGIAGL